MSIGISSETNLGGVVVIDAGFPGYISQFEEVLEKHQIDPKELKAVLLTHAHNDHIGCAEAIRQRFQIPIYIHEADQSAALKIDHLPPMWFVKNCWRLPVSEIHVSCAIWW